MSSYPSSGIVRFESRMKDDYDPSRTYVGMNKANCKPNGLWLSTINTSTNWRTWQEEKDDNKSYKQFDVSMDNILIIDSITKLSDFTNKYKNDFVDTFSTDVICWSSVIKVYDGIFIHNFNREDLFLKENFDTLNWYLNYDCDTLVVWNLSCVSYVLDVNKTSNNTDKSNDDCWIG